MGTAKRFYLYAVSAISLLVLSVGLYNLAAVALGEIADSVGATIIGGDPSGREQLSLAIALVVVGAPVFAIHWWLIARGWHGMGETAADDRRSTIRAFHLGLVATVALGLAMFAALQILDELIGTVLGVDRFDDGRFSDDLAMLTVATPVWWYHTHLRNADIRHDRLSGAASWLTRLHRYAWAFIGLIFLVTGASQVIETLASVLIGRSGFGGDDRWWLGPLAWSISSIMVGLGVFWLHADDSRRAMRDTAIIGEDDRSSALRATYFGAVILMALVAVGVALASSLAELGRWGLGVGEATDLGAFLELVLGPWLVAIPFAVAGWVHWDAHRREAAGRSPVALGTAERLALHLCSGVGLAFLAVGAGQLLGRLVEVVLGSAAVDDFFRTEVTWFVAQIAVGGAFWIPAWAMTLRRRTASPMSERHATTGRAYLYLVVGVALIAAVPSAIYSLYRLIDTILGGRGVALGSELSIPIAIVIVASFIAAYHGRLLVSDLRIAAVAPPPAEPIALATPSTAVPESSVGASLALTLSGPVGTDLESVANSLRERLPAGVVLEGR
jgi:hypothetical protein